MSTLQISANYVEKFMLASGRLLGIACTFSIAQSAMAIPFDSAAELSQFTRNGAASTTIVWNATSGVNSGGGLRSTATAYFADSVMYTAGLPNAIGSTLFVQLDYRLQLQSGGPDLRLGFTTANTGVFDGTNDLWTETYGANATKTIEVIAPGISSSGAFLSNPDHWYRLNVTLNKTSATAYTSVTTLSYLGASGTSTPTVVTSLSRPFSSSSFGNAAQLYGGFFLYSPTNNGADNFLITLVPESSRLLWVVPLTVSALALSRRFLRLL